MSRSGIAKSPARTKRPIRMALRRRPRARRDPFLSAAALDRTPFCAIAPIRNRRSHSTLANVPIPPCMTSNTAPAGFPARLAATASAVEDVLARLLSDDPVAGETHRPPVLLAAMRHAVLAGGKRFR